MVKVLQNMLGEVESGKASQHSQLDLKLIQLIDGSFTQTAQFCCFVLVCFLE
jgi:hypothetical protein